MSPARPSRQSAGHRSWGLDISTDEGQAAFAFYTWNNGGGLWDADGNWALNSKANARGRSTT